MLEVFGELGEYLASSYNYLQANSASFPLLYNLIQISILVLIIVLISVIIFRFYKSAATKNLISMNLNQYNKYEHPASRKFLAVLLYILEYIVIVPFFIVLWAIGFAVAILLLSEGNTIQYVLFLSSALIASVRILAYYKSEISKDVAKLFPFITLSVFLLSTNKFDFANVFIQLNEVPALLNSLYAYFIFIFLLEIFLRVVDTIIDFSRSEDKRKYIH